MNRYLVVVPDRRTVEAYRALAAGRGGAAEWALFIADLEMQSGFRQVTAADASLEETKFAEGQRSVFARIDTLMRITDAALDQIEAAEHRNKEPIE